MNQPPPETQPQTKTEKLPVREKLAFATGAVPDMIGFHAPLNIAGPIYNVTLGVSPGLVGIAIGVTRIWDAILDPIMGSISDNSDSRHGRRRPFIVLGAILTGLCFIVMTMVPSGFGEYGYFFYYTLTMLLFYAAFTVYSVPFHAIGYEMSPDYHERTNIMSYRMFFNMFGTAIAGWFFPATQMALFEGDTMAGMKRIGVVVGVIIMGLGIVPGLFLKERNLKIARAQDKVSVKESVKYTFRSKPFILIISMAILNLCSANLANTVGTYVNFYHVYEGRIAEASVVMGWSSTASSILTMLSLPAWTRVAKVVEKRQLLCWSFVLLGLGSVSKWFFFTPEYPYLQLLMFIFIGPANIGFWLAIHSMIGDVCDSDELENGSRREGMFGAVLTWVQKVGISAASVVSGFVLVFIGFDAQLGGDQSPATILGMRVLFSGLPVLAVVWMLWLQRRYPLNGAAMREIRAELERRRGSV